MAIQQTKKRSDLEKRLQLLRRQVYGKEENKKSSVYGLPSTEIAKHSILQPHQTTAEVGISDITYLHQDLLKILIFASCAIGGQAILFFLLKNHILNINFF